MTSTSTSMTSSVRNDHFSLVSVLFDDVTVDDVDERRWLVEIVSRAVWQNELSHGQACDSRLLYVWAGECNWTDNERQVVLWAYHKWKHYQFTSLRVCLSACMSVCVSVCLCRDVACYLASINQSGTWPIKSREDRQKIFTTYIRI